MKQPKIALLTNCTATSAFEPAIRMEDAPEVRTMSELCEWWAGEFKAVPKEDWHTPGEIFRGISTDTVTEIAQIIGHENVYIVSRGSGFTGFNQLSVSYNFLFDRSDPHSAIHKVKGEKFNLHVWWELINTALHGTPSPISHVKHADGSDYDFIIATLPNSFVKMASRDLLSLPNVAARLYMLLPQSAVMFVPRALRKCCIPYNKEYAANLTYTRYDKSHKVSMKFLLDGLKTEDFGEYAEELKAEQHQAIGGTRDAIDYKAVFKQHPRLLETRTPEAAMHMAKVLGLKIGSNVQFCGAWRGATMTMSVDVTQEQMDVGADMLQQVIAMGGPRSDHNTEELLKHIGMFIEVVRKQQPDMVFTAKEVSSWGKLMFGVNKAVASSGKVSAILKTHTTYLGLIQSSGSNHLSYRVAT